MNRKKKKNGLYFVSFFIFLFLFCLLSFVFCLLSWLSWLISLFKLWLLFRMGANESCYNCGRKYGNNLAIRMKKKKNEIGTTTVCSNKIQFLSLQNDLCQRIIRHSSTAYCVIKMNVIRILWDILQFFVVKKIGCDDFFGFPVRNEAVRC